MNPGRRVHVLIAGRVHGVAFRDSTRRKAEELGIAGWVRNLRDGRVEALFEGPHERVESVLAWCRVGPPLAHVEGVRTEDQPATGELASFAVRPTAADPLA